MSVRAYRVVEIKTENTNSFNLWHDEKLFDFLCQECDFCDRMGSEGTGLTEVPVEVMQKAIGQAKKLKLDPETVAQLQKDIEATEAQGDDYIQYYCF